ncbi:glycoside hydrolase family 65 protein [Telluribacter sp.]|jgi:alpha,alpha-trehalase|uniref:glycoside hydrolase family 65 protein n=1 Tax=Telluribacter sp. TaxID=1978767 RepID=UPI002E112309|nr:glycosyl hydrolase family 65 protein [Telluribacter sp.]
MQSNKGTFLDWSIRYHHYDAADEGRREALFALGNGYLVSRAATPESAEDKIHYPGTYRVGCYNRLSTLIEGKVVENDSLVNLPNWLPLTFRIEGESWFLLEEVEILTYQQELHLDKALLERHVRFKTREGRICSLFEKRFLSMAQEHLMVLQQEIKVENWSGTLEVRSGLDGDVQNNNVARYAPFNKRHLQILSSARIGQECLELVGRTVQSGIDIALLARTRLQQGGKSVSCHRTVQASVNSISEYVYVKLKQDESLVVEKVVALYTSHDKALSDCREATHKALAQAQDFESLFKAHAAAWKKLWQHCRLDMIPQDQLPFLRLHIFQILQNISLHAADLDVGVPPSGWQGEEYHGQIFWDEMFLFPFLTFRFPTIARSLLLYRYRRLDAARSLAREAGYQGAMYPWRSARSGREETPLLQYNLYSKHWMEDFTYLQYHIGAIIAYSISNYVEVTGDKLFLADYGAEMLIEIARFWASLAQYNPESDRYEIRGVVGPDEHHTRYPDANPKDKLQRGINNNTYTNVMAAWTLLRAGQMYHQLTEQQQKDLQENIQLSPGELEKWESISRKIYLVILKDGTLDQFKGFIDLKSFDLEAFRQKWGNQRVDWRLVAQGDDTNHYKLSKQADTSLLLYLFSPTELQGILQHMGYSLSMEQLKKTIDLQMVYTANESSLSRIIHAGALAHLDGEASWLLFQKAQQIDLSPSEDEGSSEGIHLGAMGGTLGVIQHHYAGIGVQEGTLSFNPALPDSLMEFSLNLLFRGVELECRINRERIWVKSLNRQATDVTIRHARTTHKLTGGESFCFIIKV